MNQTWDDLKEQLSILDVLEHFGLDYKTTHGSSGPQVQVRECPCCGNDKYKVYLNEETGLGNCFRCDQTFNLLSFTRAVMGGEEVAWREVRRQLKQLVGDLVWRPKRVGKPVTFEADLQLPASMPMPTDEGKMLTYLTDRRIDTDLALDFHLRYCHRGHFEYRLNGEVIRQRYDRRVIIPIFDAEGRLVSFQGRDITGQSPRKYLFPTGFAATGRHLYNLHNVRGLARLIVGEGVFDVMGIHRALRAHPEVGAIGTFGKHLSHLDKTTCQDQLGAFVVLQAQGLKEVTFMWDAEPEAFRAAIRAGKLLRSLGLSVRIAQLPEGLDPGEAPDQVIQQAWAQASLLTPSLALKLSLCH